MGRVHWLEKGIMVVVLVIVIIAIGLGAYILLQSILSYKACNCQWHLQDPYCLQPIARHKMSFLILSKTDIYYPSNVSDIYMNRNVTDI